MKNSTANVRQGIKPLTTHQLTNCFLFVVIDSLYSILELNGSEAGAWETAMVLSHENSTANVRQRIKPLTTHQLTNCFFYSLS